MYGVERIPPSKENVCVCVCAYVCILSTISFRLKESRLSADITLALEIEIKEIYAS